ncbi:DUF2795 domain-containing protein [Streptomyces sp. NPDC058475]|uniref:DUF2795 domain-containing protein n=1 Tax=Streptomyces sp. NPDC058475 TaxID=3346518 RepID=UPI003667D66A
MDWAVGHRIPRSASTSPAAGFAGNATGRARVRSVPGQKLRRRYVFHKRTDVLDPLQDVDFPTGKDELVQAAENAGAPRLSGQGASRQSPGRVRQPGWGGQVGLRHRPGR